jgi:hypothetical protein
MVNNRPRRRWLTLSLRATLLAILALSVWLGWWVNSARNQEAAVATVNTAPFSANAIYDDDPDYFPQDAPIGRRFGRTVKSWIPPWLRAKLGKDYVDNVLAIAFSRDGPPSGGSDIDVFRKIARVQSLDQLNPEIEVVDADVMEIARLPNLKRLALRASCPRLTDASLRTLAGMPRLEVLEIHDAPITDAGLAQLGTLRGLKSLLVGEARPFSAGGNSIAVTGIGLTGLTSLPALAELEVYSPALAGGALRHVGQLRHLRRLRLKGCSFTDDDLRYLAPLTELESLEVVGSCISGKGFGHLSGLAKLRDVCLESPSVTDEAVPLLARLPSLRSVMIYSSRVTAPGLEGFQSAPKLNQIGLIPAVTGDTKRLKQSLPGCSICNGGTVL